MLLALPQVAAARVVISEVLWAGSALSTADEWVEVTCEESKDAKESEESEELGELCPADIGGWSLYFRNSAGTDILMFVFPEGAIIERDEVILISNYAAGESALSIEPDFVTTAVSLPNTGLRLMLKNGSGVTVDTVDDGVGAPFAGRSSEPKASMERVDVFASGETASNWKTAESSVNFDVEAGVMGSPGVVDVVTEDTDVTEVTEDTEGTEEAEESEVSSSSSFSSPSSSSSSYTSVTLVTSAPSVTTLRISEVLPNPVGTDDREWIEIENTGATEINIAGWKLKRGTASYVFPNLTASGYIVEPGGFRIYYKFESKLTLSNDGGLVELLNSSGTLIDSFFYNGGGEGVSSGRDADGNRSAYCVPTPLASNTVTAFDPKIEIQSGRSTDYDDVTLNLNMSANTALADVRCLWNFGDDETSESCNPSSHTWSEYGVYRVKLTAVSACAEEAERELEVVVLEKKQKAQASVSHSSVASFTSPTSVTSFASVSSVTSVTSCVPSSSTGLTISAIYPAPSKGEDEWIELRNVASFSIDLCGWSLDDITDGGSKPWKIENSLSIAPDGSRKFFGSETKIALNNSGDDVRLLNARGEVIGVLTYKNAKTGAVISPNVSESMSSEFSSVSKQKSEQKNYSSTVKISVIGSVMKQANVKYAGRGFSSASSVLTLEQLPEEYREVFEGSEMPIFVDTPKSASPVLLTLIIIQSIIFGGFAIWRVL